MRKKSIIFVSVIGGLYLAATLIFLLLPRSTYSELEKRELNTFPEYSFETLKSGAFTAAVSSWFSDSEPYRDELMYQSMLIKDMTGISIGEENVVFHAPETPPPADYGDESNDGKNADSTKVKKTAAPAIPTPGLDLEGFVPSEKDTSVVIEGFDYEEDDLDSLDVNAKAKVYNSGIIIVGSGAKTRALIGFFGSIKSSTGYALIANKYKQVLGPDVNVYVMPIPTSTEFYCPPSASKFTKKQWPVFNNIFENLAPDVKAVDIYSDLAQHTKEKIYLRTDHHWAPLGAYYAAKKLAEVAGVPFRDLSAYEEKVVPNFVGSMYGYSHDLAVKKAPEDFVYHIPKDVEYTTTYVVYQVDADYHVTGSTRPYKDKFFYTFKPGSSGAFSTFMGSDMKLTKVETSTKNGRKVLILKDSFGNAIPGYLFYSFEEIHVIDFRYFTKNIVNYIHENGITDVVFTNNAGNACLKYVHSRYDLYLTQGGGAGKTATSKPEETRKKENADDRANEARVDSSSVELTEPSKAPSDSIQINELEKIVQDTTAAFPTIDTLKQVSDSLPKPPVQLMDTL